MATPQGTVQLMLAGVPFGAAVPLNPDGTYAFSVSNLPVGDNQQLVTVYTSTNGLDSSQSPPVMVNVNPPDLNTATSLAASPTTSNQGDPVAISGAVTSV